VNVIIPRVRRHELAAAFGDAFSRTTVEHAIGPCAHKLIMLHSQKQWQSGHLNTDTKAVLDQEKKQNPIGEKDGRKDR
jgi:hypothetical protein